MISDGIKKALKEAAEEGTMKADLTSKPFYVVKLDFNQLVALMEHVDEWNASQNRDWK